MEMEVKVKDRSVWPQNDFETRSGTVRAGVLANLRLRTEAVSRVKK
jgi:hypothetical protein